MNRLEEGDVFTLGMFEVAMKALEEVRIKTVNVNGLERYVFYKGTDGTWIPVDGEKAKDILESATHWGSEVSDITSTCKPPGPIDPEK